MGGANIQFLASAVFPDRAGLYVSTSGIMPNGEPQGDSQADGSDTLVSAGVYRNTNGFPLPQVFLPVTVR